LLITQVIWTLLSENMSNPDKVSELEGRKVSDECETFVVKEETSEKEEELEAEVSRQEVHEETTLEDDNQQGQLIDKSYDETLKIPTELYSQES
jgi:hypothetical protein